MAFGFSVLTQQGMVSTEDILAFKLLGESQYNNADSGNDIRIVDVHLDWSGFAAGTVCLMPIMWYNSNGSSKNCDLQGSPIYEPGNRPSLVKVRHARDYGSSAILTVQVWGVEV